MQISVRRLARELHTNLRPRELFYWTIGNGIYWGFRLTMRVQLQGVAEHYGPPSASTLIISTHKRDWDPILCATYGHYHRGWLAPDLRRFGFAGRADMWDRGFLATVVGYRNWPAWAQRLLDVTSFAPIANRMRVYPILRVPEYTLRQYFRTLLHEKGNLPLSAVLSMDTLLAFTQREDELHAREHHDSSARLPDALRLRDALHWNYRALTNRPAHAHHLMTARYQHLREWLRSTIDQQLETLAHSMDSGDTLWFAPEGAVTLDGKVMRLRNGLYTLLERIRADARILPANVTYDFMTNRRRMIACLAIGPELHDLRGLERSEQARQVARALALQTTVTMSQLASKRVLAHLEAQAYQFDPETEALLMQAEVRRLARLGAWVQRDLLTVSGLRRRLRSFLAYAEAESLLLPDDEGGYLVSGKPLKNTSSRYWENPVRYCANELEALEAALHLHQRDSGSQQALESVPAPEREAERPGKIEASAG
jgi:hypothetical protein